MLLPSAIQRSDDLVGIATPTVPGVAAAPLPPSSSPHAARLSASPARRDDRESACALYFSILLLGVGREDPARLATDLRTGSSEPLREPVVGLVPAQLLAEPRTVVSSSISASSVPVISARSPRCSSVSAVDSTVWCGPPAVSQASVEVRRSGAGRHTARATGRFGSGCVRRDDLDLVGDEAEPVAEVGHAEHDGRARARRRRPAGPGPRGRRCRAGGSRASGLPAAMRRADLEHVRAEDLLLARDQVVGVVLHERRAAGQPVGDHLERAQQHRGLPVALAAEAVAVGHQPLHGEPGQLAQPAEVLEVGGERA